MKSKRNDDDTPMSETTLINQLITAVSEDSVRRVLKKRVIQEPEVSFLELRECALRWTDMKKPKNKISQIDSGLDVNS